MPALLIRHRVSDYAAWARDFDEQESIRWSYGCRGAQIFRNTADPGEMVILLTWDDLIRARFYSLSDDLRESMKRGGLADDPDIWILERAEDMPG